MIPDERERPLWMVGQKVLLEAEFRCGTQSFFLSLAERGEGRGWKGIFPFVLKDIVHAKCFQAHF